MAQGHAHGPGGHAGHDHTAGASARRLGIALSLTGTFLLVEVAGAFWFDSLALLSDAGHMLTDVAALAIALAAVRIGERPADARRTFGYKRFEVLAAALNALLLLAVAIYVLIEAVDRFRAPTPVQPTGMLLVAGTGLVINLAAMRLLASGKDASLNMKGAYLEVWADMLGSIGVIIGALVIRFTGWMWVDPLVAVAIGLWVLPRTWILLRDTTNILLEGAPRGLDLAAVRAEIGAVAGVTQVHDLHVWSLTAKDASLSVHAAVDDAARADGVRTAIAGMLATRFGIQHATVQIEGPGAPCDAPGLHA